MHSKSTKELTIYCCKNSGLPKLTVEQFDYPNFTDLQDLPSKLKRGAH